jgi:hypothetical protein
MTVAPGDRDRRDEPVYGSIDTIDFTGIIDLPPTPYVPYVPYVPPLVYVKSVASMVARMVSMATGAPGMPAVSSQPAQPAKGPKGRLLAGSAANVPRRKQLRAMVSTGSTRVRRPSRRGMFLEASYHQIRGRQPG